MSMMINLHESAGLGSTIVSNRFIDEFMPKANGEYVKIYLYLLRCLGANQSDFAISNMAEVLEHTEGDILRALNYWEKAGLLALEYNQQKQLVGIRFLNGREDEQSRKQHETGKAGVMESQERALSGLQESSPQSITDAALATVDKDMSNVRTLPTKPLYNACQIAAFTADPEVAQLVYCVERYLGRPLTEADQSYMLYWSKELEFSMELIEYLIEYAVSTRGAGKISSLRVLQAMAETWYHQNIRTPKEAKGYQRGAQSGSLDLPVMRALGIKGRNLAESEKAMVSKWAGAWGFEQDMILEACRRTIAKTHEPSFAYADSILANWLKSNISTLDAVQKSDDEFKARQELQLGAAKSAKSGRTASSVSKDMKGKQYYACPSRDYDYDNLAKDLLQKQS